MCVAGRGEGIMKKDWGDLTCSHFSFLPGKRVPDVHLSLFFFFLKEKRVMA